MGSYTKRHFFLSVCVLQMVTVAVRQVFDFLGFMWGPVLANFFQILFIIFGFFGACQFRVKYLASYTIWSVFWFSWNIFVVCFYLNIGGLNRNQNILNLGTGSVSWWESNGPGCKPLFHANLTTVDDPLIPIRPDSVVGCVLDYQYVEALQASIQNFLAMIGILISVSLLRVMLDDDDSFEFMGGFDGKGPEHVELHPMYVSEHKLNSNVSLSSRDLISTKACDDF